MCVRLRHTPRHQTLRFHGLLPYSDPANVAAMKNPEIAGDHREKRSTYDSFIYASCVSLGAIQFLFYERCDYFVSMPTYYELARSLVEQGFYGYDGRPETIFPPGCAALIALVWICFGNSYSTLIHAMAVFATLFLITSYELLRRQVGRSPAAAISLIIGTSPFFFHFSTHGLGADIPYAFTTTLALLVATHLGASTTRGSRAALWLSFTALLACSLMLRSAAMALLAALAAWLTTSVIARPSASRVRLRTFLTSLAIGIAIQGVWMTWARNHEQLEWPPINGYTGSYVPQIFLKQGNNPELGPASLADIPVRLGGNLAYGSASLLGILARRWIEPAWNSPLILGTVLLILLGLRCSSWADSSGLIQWYFTSYVMMYLLWPWEFEMRFVLPVAPLACMYLWRGCVYLANQRDLALLCLGRHRYKLQIGVLFLSIPMALVSALLLVEHRQGKQSIFFWSLLAVGAVCAPAIKTLLSWMMSKFSFRNTRPIVAAILVSGIVAVGLFMQIRMGIKNLEFDLKKQPTYPDIEAAQWIMSHTNPEAVVMAFNTDIVHHYSGRRIIRRPPSRDPELLMSGIIKHGIDLLIVVDGENWLLPQDTECFTPLAKAYPDAFHLVHEGPRNRVFEVCRNLQGRTRKPAG